MKLKLWKTTILVLSIILLVEKSHAFGVDVHKRISKNAIDTSSANLNSSISNIGLKNGILEELNGVKIRDWIEEGSKQEDEPLLALRYLKHFYNPIDDSGLLFYNSSYVWANDYYANAWSWRAARNKFYEGLTATTGNARGYALANSFRALGQVMHLVQDLASVAHTRSDAHQQEVGV